MFCKKINIFIRSVIFFIYTMMAISIFSLLVISSVVLPLPCRYRIIRIFMRLTMWVLRVVCHLDYKVEGLENIPTDRNGVILSKHQSTWETFFLPLLFPMPAIIVKRELLWVPLFGWGLAVSDPIAINRQNKTSAMQQIINKGKKCLEAGRWVLVFPEGTRIPHGTIGSYKAGGARLAVATGYPVLPIAHNAGRFWPRRKFLKHPGTITVVIGPLIETKDRTPDEIMVFVKDWIENTVARINQA